MVERLKSGIAYAFLGPLVCLLFTFGFVAIVFLLSLFSGHGIVPVIDFISNVFTDVTFQDFKQIAITSFVIAFVFKITLD